MQHIFAAKPINPMSEPSETSLPPDPTACAPGQLLGGKYRLIRMLGEGGMGNVWLARNELLDLDVALKIVRPDARGSETTARLLTEARVQANLRHPNVARVFDYGQSDNGDSYLVLELLEGYSLAELLEQRGAIRPVQAVQLLLPVIDALCAAHEAGVVHRDLKPDNIFLARSGNQLCPKLLDFGIAKLEGQSDRRLTGSGGVVGSPAYMAPEQARGFDDIDQRADVWAACVVLYESVSGKPAFDAENYHALLRKVIETDVEPLTEPGCATLWPIIRAGLAKDRAQRTASMCELGASLERWLSEQGAAIDSSPEPLGWRWVESGRESRDPRALTGVRSHLSSLGHGLALPKRGVKRAGIDTQRTGEREVQQPVWKLSIAAAVGGGLLALGFGQAWMPVDAETEPDDEVAVVRPAAVIPAIDAPRAAPAREPRTGRTDKATAPAKVELARAEAPTRPRPAAPDKVSEPAKPAPASKPQPAAAVAVVAAPPPEPVAARPQLTAADLMKALDAPAATAPPATAPAATAPGSAAVRLTSAYPRAPQAAANARANDSSSSSTPAQQSAVKRRASPSTNEAELGLKSPW